MFAWNKCWWTSLYDEAFLEDSHLEETLLYNKSELPVVWQSQEKKIRDERNLYFNISSCPYDATKTTLIVSLLPQTWHTLAETLENLLPAPLHVLQAHICIRAQLNASMHTNRPTHALALSHTRTVYKSKVSSHRQEMMSVLVSKEMEAVAKIQWH